MGLRLKRPLSSEHLEDWAVAGHCDHLPLLLGCPLKGVEGDQTLEQPAPDLLQHQVGLPLPPDLAQAGCGPSRQVQSELSG